MIQNTQNTDTKATKKRKIKKIRKNSKFNFLLKSLIKKNHKSKFFKIIIILISIFVLFLLSILLFKSNDILQVRKVICYQDEQQCSKNFYDLLINVTGSNILNFDSAQFERNLINLNPLVSSVKINKKLPCTIEFKFLLRKPLAVVVDINNRTTFVDEKGKIYAQSDNPDLTHIFINEAVSVGEDAASNTLQTSLNLIKAMEDSFIPTKQIDSREDGVTKMILYTGQTIIIDHEKDIYKQVDALQLILQNSKMLSEDQPIKTIDLRFDNPVVR